MTKIENFRIKTKEVATYALKRNDNEKYTFLPNCSLITCKKAIKIIEHNANHRLSTDLEKKMLEVAKNAVETLAVDKEKYGY